MKKILAILLAVLTLASLITIPSFAEGTNIILENTSFDNLDDAVSLSRGNRVTLTGDFSWESTIKDFYGTSFTLAANGNTLKLDSDISINSGSHAIFRDIVVDLQGHSITVTARGKVTLGKGTKVINGGGKIGGAFALSGIGAELIMEDGSEITSCKADMASAISLGSGSKLTMEGGKITGNEATSKNGGAIRAITDSEIILSGNATVTGNTAAGENCNIVVVNEKILKLYRYYIGKAGVTKEGGNKRTEPFGIDAGATGAENLFSDQDEELTAVIDDYGRLVWGEAVKIEKPVGGENNTPIVEENPYEQKQNLTDEDKAEAQKGKTFETRGNYYTDLGSAISDADGETIRLISNAEWTGALRDFYSADINIDGNGFTLKLTQVIVINTGSTMHLTNITVDLNGKCFKAHGSSGHIIYGKGCTLINGGGDFGGATTSEGSGSVVTMLPGSKITGAKGIMGCGIASLTGGTIELLGGIIENGVTEQEGAVLINPGAKVVLGGDFTMKNNKTGANETGIKIGDIGALTVQGEFTGSVGIKFTGNPSAGIRIGTDAGGAKGTEKIYMTGNPSLVVVTDGNGGLTFGSAGSSIVSSGTSGSSNQTGTTPSGGTTTPVTGGSAITPLSEKDKAAAAEGKIFKLNNNYYSDLGSAIVDSQGVKITMVGSGEWTGPMKDFYNSKINIDGNGFVLKIPNVIVINSGSSMTLTNITVDLNKKCFKAHGSSGHITYGSGCTLINGGGDFGGATTSEGPGSIVTMLPGSKIVGAKGIIGCGIASLTGGTIELLGGSIEDGKSDSGGVVKINPGAKVVLGGDFTLKNNKSGGSEGGINIGDIGALTVRGNFTGSAGIKFDAGATEGQIIGKDAGGATGTEKIYLIGNSGLVVVTDGKGNLTLGKKGSSTVSDKEAIEKAEKEEELKKAEEASIYYVDKSSWKATANSGAWNRTPDKAIDNDPKSVWHTEYGWEDNKVTWKTPLPHNLDVDFGKEIDVAGFTLITNPGAPAGQPTKMNFYVKIKGEYQLVKEYKFNVSSTSYSQTIVNDFGASVKAEGVRLLYLDALDGHGTLAELEIIKPKEGMKSEPFEDFLYTMGKNALYPIPLKEAEASYDGEDWGRSVVERVLDGSTTTAWQANTNMKAPYNLTIDLGEVCTLSGFTYTPRQVVYFDGYWESYNIHISDDGVNYRLLEEKLSFLPRTLAASTHTFPEKVTTRYIRFEILRGTGNLGSCAELEFLEDFEAYMARRERTEQYYTLTIGKNEIVHKNGTETIDVAPYIENGTTFIPLRGLLELMGAEVTWDGEYRAVTIKKDTTEIYLQIRNKNVFVTTSKNGKERYTLLAAPRIENGRTFIPVRFVSEMLGYTVTWDGETQEVKITN